MCCGLHLVLCLVVSVDLQGPGTDSERKHCQGKGRLAIRGEIVFHTRDILSISLISMLLLDSFLLCLINIVYLLFDLQVFCVCVLLSCSGTQICSSLIYTECPQKAHIIKVIHVAIYMLCNT